MNTLVVDKIASAVLYEGYILYPYRPSIKNQRRTMFGGLYPPRYAAACGGTERSSAYTACLVEGDLQTAVEVQIRFLHWVERHVGLRTNAASDDLQSAEFEHVPAVEIDGGLYQSWEEAIERRVNAGPFTMADLVEQSRSISFEFPAARDVEWVGYVELGDTKTRQAVALIRERQRVRGAIELSATQLTDDLLSLRATIENTTPEFDGLEAATSDAARLHALHSTHTILHVEQGRFVSMIDPPEHLRQYAEAQRSDGTWPVLIGDEGSNNMILSSPIILYDHPQVADESPGDFFDATEIDEMLGLRIATLTLDEKRRMHSVDAHARAVLARTQNLTPERMLNLHGVIRGMRRVDAGQS